MWLTLVVKKMNVSRRTSSREPLCSLSLLCVTSSTCAELHVRNGWTAAFSGYSVVLWPCPSTLFSPAQWDSRNSDGRAWLFSQLLRDDCKNALVNDGDDCMHLHDLLVFPSEVVELFCVKCWALTYIYLQTSFRNVLQFFLTSFSSMPYRKEKRCSK